MNSKITFTTLLTLSLVVSSCSNQDIYEGKTEEQVAQMYHEARVKIVKRWTCNVFREELTQYKKDRLKTLDPYEIYFSKYPYQFKLATTSYKSIIKMTLKDEPYKLPNNELDISYIQPFAMDELGCNEVISEWSAYKDEWRAINGN